MTSVTWPDGYGRRVLSVVDSTLDEARRLAPELAGPEWIMALHQTAGRGRRGRSWATLEGNLAATLIMPLNGPPQHAALRSFVAAVALRRTMVAFTGNERCFELKWPNDVLARGSKVAGILLESVSTNGTLSHLSIGIGVNLAEAPDSEALEPQAVAPTTLRALGLTIGPEAFLDQLAVSYDRYETQFVQFGFEPIRKEWIRHAARLGHPIVARTIRDTWNGTFEDVDGAGQLVLNTAKGRIAIAAADVYF